jgi:hypothetical protein
MFIQSNFVESRHRAIGFKINELKQRAAEIFNRFETCVYQMDHNNPGVFVGIRSYRDSQIVATLEKSVFRGYMAHHSRRDETGMLWVRFGFL